MNKKTPLIMVVEDESVLLQTVSTKLKATGIETLTCNTSKQCLDYLENVVEMPDAIWLDYYLEGSMNALQLLIEMKKNPLWSDIPTVIVSNSASKDKVDAMLALGAQKYLLKAEYKLSEIVHVFRELVETK